MTKGPTSSNLTFSHTGSVIVACCCLLFLFAISLPSRCFNVILHPPPPPPPLPLPLPITHYPSPSFQSLDEAFVSERQAHVRHIAAQRKELPAHLQGEDGLVKIQVGRQAVNDLI